MFEASLNHLQLPGICALCEDAPPSTGRLVDTGYNFIPPMELPTRGRRYICERCVKSGAMALGWDVDSLSQEYDIRRELERRVAELEDESRSQLAQIEGLTGELRDAILAAIKPKPARKNAGPQV